MARDTDEKTISQRLIWAQRLQALAQTGSFYAKDPFDSERYSQIGEIAKEMYDCIFSIDEEQYERSLLFNLGYATPKVDVRGVCTANGKILLVRERSDSRWCLPGGWVDVGETPSSAVIREVFEEYGKIVTTSKLIGVFDGNRGGGELATSHAYKLYFLCDIVEETCATRFLETDDVQFFDENEIPPLSSYRTPLKHLMECFTHLRNPTKPSSFD